VVLSASVVALAAAVLAPGAAASDALAPSASDLPGWHAAGSGPAVARFAIGSRLPRNLRRVRAAGSAFRVGDRRLALGVFSLRSARRARSAFAPLRKGGRRLTLADQAVLVRRGRMALVRFRLGATIGGVRFSASGGALALAGARAFAAMQVSRLRRIRSLTGYQRALDGIRPDGTVTPRVALRAFAALYGPLPGVRPPRGARGRPVSGTLAIMLVRQVWDRLGAAQRSAIERQLSGRLRSGARSAGAESAAAPADLVLTPDPASAARVAHWLGVYRARVPGLPAIPVQAFRTDKDWQAYGNTVAADAQPVDGARRWNPAAPTSCMVRVTPAGAGQAPGILDNYTLAHEAFHCVQFWLSRRWYTLAPWIIEGTADWAAETVTGESAPYRSALARPREPLFGRTYDANGFWGRVDELGGGSSLWGKAAAILGASGSPDAFGIAGADFAPFLETWASSMFRFADRPEGWYQRKPFAIPFESIPIETLPVTGSQTLVVPAYSTYHYKAVADPRRPLVRFLPFSGYLRATDRRQEFGPVQDEYYCLGRCECPPGSRASIPFNVPVRGGVLYLGFSAARAQGVAEARYEDLDRYCRPEPPSGRGSAETNGDPHITSHDGLHFGFQAAGEFLLVRSRSGDLQVQARQEPFGRDRTISVNTQVAMRIGGRRVTVSPGATDLTPVAVRVDGRGVALPAGQVLRLAGGATLSRGRYLRLVAAWPDGSTVEVSSVGMWGVAARIALAPARAGHVAGLLGNFDGVPGNDLATRSGSRLRFGLAETRGWAGDRWFYAREELAPAFQYRLYDVFGESWRVRPSESLFDYRRGQTTRTFTNRSIPTGAASIRKLYAGQRAAAERTCRAAGVTAPGPLNDCILDVALTRRSVFATSVAQLHAPPVAPSPPPAGGRPDLTIALNAGDFRVYNTGTADAAASVTEVRIGTAPAVRYSVPAIPKGASYVHKLGCVAGSRTAVADADNQVTESNESNNGAALNVGSCP